MNSYYPYKELTCIDPINGEVKPSIGEYSDGTVCSHKCPEGFKHKEPPTGFGGVFQAEINCKCSGTGASRCRWSAFRLRTCVPEE